MTASTIPHPPIVSRDQWLAARKQLLAPEKELTKQLDRVNAERRRLPMVKIEKDYAFDGPNGKQALNALFDGRRQLIVYHFMLARRWNRGALGAPNGSTPWGIFRGLNVRAPPWFLFSRARW